MTNVGGSSGPIEVKQWFLNSGQFDNFKPDGLTADQLDSAVSANGHGRNANQVMQSASVTQSSPASWPTFGLSDELFVQIYRGKAGPGYDGPDSLAVALDEMRWGTGSLDDVTPLAVPIWPGTMLIVR